MPTFGFTPSTGSNLSLLGGYGGGTGMSGGYSSGGYGGGYSSGGYGGSTYRPPAAYTPAPQLFDMSALSRFAAPSGSSAHAAPAASPPIAGGSSLPMPRHASTEVAPRVPDSLASRAESFQKLAYASLEHPRVAGFFLGCAERNLTDEQVIRGIQKLAAMPGGKEDLQEAMEKVAIPAFLVAALPFLKTLGWSALAGAGMWGGERALRHVMGRGQAPDHGLPADDDSWIHNPSQYLRPYSTRTYAPAASSTPATGMPAPAATARPAPTTPTATPWLGTHAEGLSATARPAPTTPTATPRLGTHTEGL